MYDKLEKNFTAFQDETQVDDQFIRNITGFRIVFFQASVHDHEQVPVGILLAKSLQIAVNDQREMLAIILL